MKHLVAIAASALLCACGFMTPAKQYDGEKQNPSEIAVIQSVVGNPFADDYHATIASFQKIEADGNASPKKLGLPGFTDYPKEIHVLPGNYMVELYCFNLHFSSYRPSLFLAAKAGTTYWLNCEYENGHANALLVEQVETERRK